MASAAAGAASGISRVAADARGKVNLTGESAAPVRANKRGRWGLLNAGGPAIAPEKVSQGGAGAGSGGSGGSGGGGGGGGDIESSKTAHAAAAAAAASASAGAKDGGAASASGSVVSDGSVQWASGEGGEHAGKTSGDAEAALDQDVGSEAEKLGGGALKREQHQQEGGILSRVKSMQHRAGRTQVRCMLRRSLQEPFLVSWRACLPCYLCHVSFV